MHEFDKIKTRIKMAIMMEPTLSLKVQHDYCDLLEECNSMDEIPDELKRYVKIVLTEFKEEQEELEESKNEMKDIVNINDVITSLDKTINSLEECNSYFSDEQSSEDRIEVQSKEAPLFDYIDENGKVNIKAENISKPKKYDWKRDLRSALNSIILIIDSEDFHLEFAKNENGESIPVYPDCIKRLNEVYDKYKLHEELNIHNEIMAQQLLNKQLLQLNQSQLIFLLSYLLQKEKQQTGILVEYINNRIFVRISTLLYNHLYHLI